MKDRFQILAAVSTEACTQNLLELAAAFQQSCQSAAGSGLGGGGAAGSILTCASEVLRRADI